MTTALQQPIRIHGVYSTSVDGILQHKILYKLLETICFPTHIHVLIAVVVVVSTRYKKGSPPRDRRGNLFVN